MFAIELFIAAFLFRAVGTVAVGIAQPAAIQPHEPELLYGVAFAPVQEDLEMIRLELSRSMRDPESTLISNVAAIHETNDANELMTWVCGYVQGRNGYGGYAQPAPFVGMLLDTPAAGRVFVTISIADTDPASHVGVLEACNTKFQP